MTEKLWLLSILRSVSSWSTLELRPCTAGCMPSWTGAWFDFSWLEEEFRCLCKKGKKNCKECNNYRHFARTDIFHILLMMTYSQRLRLETPEQMFFLFFFELPCVSPILISTWNVGGYVSLCKAFDTVHHKMLWTNIESTSVGFVQNPMTLNLSGGLRL